MFDMYAFTQGNPGAITVANKLEMSEVEKLDSMGLQGSAVWIAFKDICKQDIRALKASIADGTIEAKVKATPDWKFEHGKAN
jgi:hypothetical protein